MANIELEPSQEAGLLASVIWNKYPPISASNPSVLQSFQGKSIDTCSIKLDDINTDFGRQFLLTLMARSINPGDPLYCHHAAAKHRGSFFRATNDLMDRIYRGDIEIQSQNSPIARTNFEKVQFIVKPGTNESAHTFRTPQVVLEGLLTKASYTVLFECLPAPHKAKLRSQYGDYITSEVVSSYFKKVIY